MADGLPNTNPMLGRLNKSAEETNELNKKIKEEGVETNEAISEQLGLIASFTEVMKNYIPKLGFIDAHTQALKLKQDQAFKVLEKIEGHLAKQAEIVDDGPEGEPDAEPEDVLPDEDVGGGGGGDADPDQPDGEEGGGPDASPLEKIAEDVSAIRQMMGDKGEDTRDEMDPVDIPKDPTDGGGAKAPKGKKLGFIGKFLKKLELAFTLLEVIVVAIVASLLTANSEIFSKIKELFGTMMKIFTQIVGLVIEKVLPAVTQIFGIIIDLVNQLLPPLMDIFSVIIEVFMMVVDALIPPLMAIIDMVVPVIISVVDALIPVIMSVVDAIMPIIQMFIDVLLPVIEIVLSIFMFIFETILLPILEFLAPVVEFLGDLMMGFFNFLIGMWNGLIESVAWLADFFGAGDSVREMKIDPIEKDESADEAKNIDFAQDDETVDAQIQAKLDSGEINEKTAERLKEQKSKFRKKQEKDRKEFVEKLDVKETDVKPVGDADAVNLISFKEQSTGATILVDPKSSDANGNYQLYDTEGNPFDVPDIGMGFKDSVMMQAHAAVESLEPKTLEEGGDGSFDIAGALGLVPDETQQGVDLGDESLDTADAQTEADNADAASGGGNQTVVSSSSTVGGSNQKTVILNDAASGSPQDGRGFYTQPN